MQNNGHRLFILCGEAFSGKSTLSQEIAKAYDAKVIGRDAIYFALDDLLALEDTPEADDHALWEGMWPIALQGVKNQLLLGNSVVVDDNCLHLRQRDELRSIAKDAGVTSALVYLDVSAQTIRERKEQNKFAKTRHDVPSAWLEEGARVFERPTEVENPIVVNEGMSAGDVLKQLANG